LPVLVGDHADKSREFVAVEIRLHGSGYFGAGGWFASGQGLDGSEKANNTARVRWVFMDRSRESVWLKQRKLQIEK
jgi:hypothetical protein